jgi:hypothetical protein
MLEAQKKANNTAGGGDNDDIFLGEGDILGPRKKVKENYEERMARIAEGREGRDKFGSSKGKKKQEVYSSSSNKEKRKTKPIMLAIQYVAVSPRPYPLAAADLPSVSFLPAPVASTRRRSSLCARSSRPCARTSKNRRVRSFAL